MKAALAIRTSIAVVGVILGTAAARAATPCTSNCSRISVGEAQGAAGEFVQVPITFTPGPNDGQADRGNDEIAAVAFTVGIPGTGEGDPLTVNCDDQDGDGLIDSIILPQAIATGFRVVVENAECNNRNRCLCPGDGQVRDDFINLAIFGPKDLPPQGPVNIPVLPNGTLLTMVLQIPSSAQENDVIPLTIFADIEGHTSIPKPEFAAFFSQGDKSAIDQTVNQDTDQAKVQVDNGQITVSEQVERCVGDCDGNGTVAVNELVTGVNIALGSPVTACLAFDADGNGTVEVNELIQGVNNALGGCP